MTLTEKAKALEFVPGHKEWSMIEDICPIVDELVKKVNEPTYGPMIEDEE